MQTPQIPHSESRIHILLLRSFIQRIRPSPRVVSPTPIPRMEDHPLSFVRGCLFSIFISTLHSWRPSLHLQPKDMPCCGDRDPPNMESYSYAFTIVLTVDKTKSISLNDLKTK
jgi:hypothetical protein